MSTTSEATGNDRRNLVNIQRIQIHKHHHQRFKSLCAYIVNGQVWRTVCWRGVWIWLIKKRGTDKVFFVKINSNLKTNISAPSRSTQTPMQCSLWRRKGASSRWKKEMKEKQHISSSKSTKLLLQVNKMVSSGAVVAQYFETEGVSHFIHVNRSNTFYRLSLISISKHFVTCQQQTGTGVSPLWRWSPLTGVCEVLPALSRFYIF